MPAHSCAQGYQTALVGAYIYNKVMLGVNLPLGGVITLLIAIQIVFKLYQTFLLANINKLSKPNKRKSLSSEDFVYFETDFVYFESHFTHFKHSLSNFKHQNAVLVGD